MDLFDAPRPAVPRWSERSPLAVRMRPRDMSEICGQGHLLTSGSPLRQLLDPQQDSVPAAVLLWGPPGTGKTTLAYLIATVGGRRFVELSAVTSGLKDVRAAIDEARQALARNGTETVLFIDEVHRFNRTQQDALLPAVENRWVTLVAATTENPSFAVASALASRSLVLTLQPLSSADVAAVVGRALTDPRGLGGRFAVDDAAVELLVRLAGGDARRALTLLEATVGGVRDGAAVGEAEVEQACDAAAVRYDRAGDQHYDVTSALIKSIRGSDPDAALHYLARMIAAGEDPRFIARRLLISASEDVGLADPAALTVAVAGAQTVQLVGMPEGRIALAQVTVYLATAPKSNAAYRGLDKALADLKGGRGGVVPTHLRDAHYPGARALGHGRDYVYPHDEPFGVAAQQYLPDDLVGTRYYTPTDRGHERVVGERLQRIRTVLGSSLDQGQDPVV